MESKKKMSEMIEPIYQGEKVFLRKMEERDTDQIVAWRNSDAVRPHFIYQELFTHQSHLQWKHTMVDTGKVDQFIICDKETRKSLGSVYIRDIDVVHNKGEYGIFLAPDAPHGKGIGTETAKLTIQYAFETRKLHRLFLRVYADNKQAIRSYEKAGFDKEAYLKDDVFVNGSYHDIILMAIMNKK
jgi:UDP-4-amino-4,6-dideoxy-N-acetyl-beta-L-altrosamine N-acetyltransferase